MIRNISTAALQRVFKRIMLFAAITAFAAVVVSCSCYIALSHDALAKWFVELNDCFYKNASWSSEFFTPGIKSDGNMYSAIGIAIALAGIVLSRRHLRLPDRPIRVLQYDTADILPVLLGCFAALYLWRWGNHIARPASDEVFSALNVAGIHPVQGVAYYMLPNNHLLFNLLNNLIFHPFPDKVWSGRLLSLTAYASIIVFLYFWLKNVFSYRWLALLSAVTLALQFQVWGFSFQARGYELYLLAEWGMVISLFSFIHGGHRSSLYINAASCVVGYFCMPSFLYFHVAQAAFMLLYGLRTTYNKKLFWHWQIIAVMATFLCYLPTLCFSGLEAITHNAYVTSMGAFRQTGRMAFTKWMFPYFDPYISHIFSGLQCYGVAISRWLYFVPLALLLAPRRSLYRMYGAFYALMWCLFFAIAIIMEKLPFERNLIGHYSLTLAGVLLVVWWLTGRLAALGRAPYVRWILFSGTALLLSVHFIRTNVILLKDTLYEYDVNTFYSEKETWLSFIPTGSTVAFSTEDFYSYYIGIHMGYKAQKCPTGNEQYYIKEAFETIPGPNKDRYFLAKKQDGNEIWQLK